METIEYRTIDKSDWPAGPWNAEPDKKQFTDEATGLPCLIVRARHGALCGYVGVAEGHPYYRKDYSQLPDSDDGQYISVHGGLTFANHCSHSSDESRGICHLPEPGEPDSVWWLGFDCAHSGDQCPAYDREPILGYEVYRTLQYVEAECASLARQLAAVSQ